MIVTEREYEILKYCEPHLDQMWAATVVAKILGCDFRDTKNVLKIFLENNVRTETPVARPAEPKPPVVNVTTKVDPALNRREEVFVRAWCSTVNANDCKSPGTATTYAKRCLEAFDEVFGK